MSTVQPVRSAPTVRGAAPWPLVVTGALAGLTWAAALRGWMMQMAGDQTNVTWYPPHGDVRGERIEQGETAEEPADRVARATRGDQRPGARHDHRVDTKLPGGTR